MNMNKCGKDIYNYIISFLPFYQRVYLQKETTLTKKEWIDMVHDQYRNEHDYHFYLSDTEINTSKMLKYALIECNKSQTEIMEMYTQIIEKPWDIPIPVKEFLKKVKRYHFNGVNLKWMLPRLYMDTIGRPANQYEAMPHPFNYFNELKIMYDSSKLLKKTQRNHFFQKITDEISKKLEDNWDWICRYHMTKEGVYIKGSFTFYNGISENIDDIYNNHTKYTCYIYILCQPEKKNFSTYLITSFYGNILSYTYTYSYKYEYETYENDEFLEKTDFLKERFFIHHTF